MPLKIVKQYFDFLDTEFLLILLFKLGKVYNVFKQLIVFLFQATTILLQYINAKFDLWYRT